MIERLPSGTIRVAHVSPQINAMHGPGTGGRVWYDVYPCQQKQYEWLNSQLPEQERAAEPYDPAKRPWWSLGAGERASLKE